MSLAGFDFQGLNKVFVDFPHNQATNYGIWIVKLNRALVYQCIGVYHLKPEENRGRHHIFIDVLDEEGRRYKEASILWRWVGSAWHTLRLTKPDNEPAADIPLSKGMVVTLQVNGLSDTASGFTSSWPDEGPGNTLYHHSFYVVFQRRRSGVVVPDPPTEPKSLEERLADLDKRMREIERWRASMEGDGR